MQDISEMNGTYKFILTRPHSECTCTRVFIKTWTTIKGNCFDDKWIWGRGDVGR